MRRVPLTVVLPTVGRSEFVARLLASISACDPAPGEVLVCDQSGGAELAAVVAAAGMPQVRVLPCEGRGIAANVNLGLRAARYDVVALTHDDCTVDPEWVGRAAAHQAAHPGGCISGRVLPVGDPGHVPSTRTKTTPWDHVKGCRFDLMMANNMVIDRRAALAIGGFDERQGLWRAGEDFDFCYRWTKAGLPVRYRPDMVVYHHYWRGPEQLVETYKVYARAKGVFYAKHIARGDVRLLVAALHNVLGGARALVSALVHGRKRWSDHRRALLLGVPLGLISGWREVRHLEASRPRTPGEEADEQHADGKSTEVDQRP